MQSLQLSFMSDSHREPMSTNCLQSEMESLTLKSKSSVTFAVPNGVRWQLLMYRLLSLLLFLLVASAPLSLKAQSKSRRVATTGSHSSKAQGQIAQIVFDYYPSPLSPNAKESEYVSVSIAGDGSTQAVRYGPYNPAIIAVYEGKLPKADVVRLVARTQLAIPKASEINIPYVRSCDSESFQLSVVSQKGSAQVLMPDAGCLMVMPADIGDLVEEMRLVWRRLPESRLAFAYVRSFPVERDLLKFNSGTKQDFIPIGKFAGKLRTVIRSARKHTPRFYPISQTQYNQIRALLPDPSHFYVIENERPYWLVVSLSRNSSQSSSLKGINPHEPSTKSSHKALPAQAFNPPYFCRHDDRGPNSEGRRRYFFDD